MIAGEYLGIDDRDGVLIGKKLAEELGLGAGSKISLLVGTSDGETDEDIFTVRGVFSTGIVSMTGACICRCRKRRPSPMPAIGSAP